MKQASGTVSLITGRGNDQQDGQRTGHGALALRNCRTTSWTEAQRPRSG